MGGYSIEQVSIDSYVFYIWLSVKNGESRVRRGPGWVMPIEGDQMPVTYGILMSTSIAQSMLLLSCHIL